MMDGRVWKISARRPALPGVDFGARVSEAISNGLRGSSSPEADGNPFENATSCVKVQEVEQGRTG